MKFPSLQSWSYNPIGTSSTDADLETDEKTTPSWLSRPRYLTRTLDPLPLTTTIIALLFLGLFVWMPRPWMQSDHPDQIRYYGCGNSTATAAAAGCKFDVMAYTWVHPSCFDQQLMYEFLGEADWRWYEGEEADSLSMGVHEVAEGQREFVYVTWDYYRRHCTYMWRKMHRSILTSRGLDSYVSDYRHTEQCEMVLLDRERELESKSVMLVAKYPSCPVVEKW